MNEIAKAVLAGSASIAVYLLVVVVTTPALEPYQAVSAAVQINPVIIFGMGAAIGIQVLISGYARRAGCVVKSFGRGSGGAGAASFFSFFSLVPLGCCGWWLYALSLLPGVLGTGVSAALIEYSVPLAYAGLAAVFGLNTVSAYRLVRFRRAVRV